MAFARQVDRVLSVVLRTSRLVVAGSFPLAYHLELEDHPNQFEYNDIDVFVEYGFYCRDPIAFTTFLHDVGRFVGVSIEVSNIMAFGNPSAPRHPYQNIFVLKGIEFLLKAVIRLDGKIVSVPLQFIIVNSQWWRNDWPDFIIRHFDISICKCYILPGQTEVTWHESIPPRDLLFDYELEITIQEFGVIWSRMRKYHSRGFRVRKIIWSCSPVWKQYILSCFQFIFTDRFVAQHSIGTETRFDIPEMYDLIRSFVKPKRPEVIDYLRTKKALLDRFSLDAADGNLLVELNELRDAMQRHLESSNVELEILEMIEKYVDE